MSILTVILIALVGYVALGSVCNLLAHFVEWIEDGCPSDMQ
jgi:hypothetical protein